MGGIPSRCLSTHPPTHTHPHPPTHTIARQTGTTQVQSFKIHVSWIVKQDRACPTPVGTFLQHRQWAEMGKHRGGCTVTSMK